MTTDPLAPALHQPGDRIGRYRVVRAIASGGFGTVYEAEVAAGGGPRVAVKVLHADGAASRVGVARFVREARLVGLIRHPSVVELLDLGELADGRPYFAMELLDGEDLRALLAREGALALATALAMLAPLCDALDAVHARGVIHRDLKASNVFVARGPAGAPRIVLLDFGVAKLLGDTGPALTRSRQTVGTPAAMAPEQLRGEPVDARTDVYALGTLTYAMLTGRAPYVADQTLLMQYMHLFAEPPPPSRIAPLDPRVDDVVARAMAKEPDQRPASAWAFLAALRAVAATAAGGGSGLVLVAVVLVHLAPGALADPDDAELATVDRLLCEGGAALVAAGFAPVIEAVDRVVLRRAPGALARVRAALAVLPGQLAVAAGGAGGPAWSVAIHAGPTGGADDPLVLGTWLPAALAPGLTVTAAAAAVLELAPG